MASKVVGGAAQRIPEWVRLGTFFVGGALGTAALLPALDLLFSKRKEGLPSTSKQGASQLQDLRAENTRSRMDHLEAEMKSGRTTFRGALTAPTQELTACTLHSRRSRTKVRSPVGGECPATV